MNERLERAVAMSADFLRDAREDLRFAAIMASETDQPRRSGSLSRAASTAKDLAGELIGAWVAARKSEPKATKLVGATLSRIPGSHRPPASIPPLEPGPTLRYGERVTFHRGSISLRMPAAVPPEVIDVLFSIALPLDLDGGATWPIESIPREVRELASDAAHNDETARTKIAIDDVCRALGLDAWIHERVMGDDVSRPATREEIITKLEGIREALEVGLLASMNTAKAIAHSLEVVEDGLTTKLAERLAEVDSDWLEALVKGSS